ncbi:MAG: CGNR zinc finger domain-containing protein [Actinomycetota bacterium]|nr:CGNR zinc finger domain-containing protein [Actinomycetota bacterium]
MASVPGWYPGEEPKPAPMPLLLVQGFLNTRDLEKGSDLLEDPGTAHDWLLRSGLLESESPLTDGELRMSRGVRESIRRLLMSNGDGGEGGGDGLAALKALAGARRPRLAVDDDGALSLDNPERRSLQGALFELLLIIRRAQEEGTWARLKVCGNPECLWVYYDRSRNQQGNWCDMAVCGNRLKNRELRARRETPTPL